MFRFALLLAGAVVGYIASGYIEGLLDEDEQEVCSDNVKKVAEEA